MTSPRIRPFRFSSPAKRIVDAKSLRDRARMLEDLGFSTMTMSDHLDAQLGPISALQAAADATTTLKVASLVFSNDFRSPPILAKEAASLDVLTDGRFEFGLGAGWMDEDYRSAGIPKEGAPTRIERMEEALVLFRRIWSGDEVDHHGAHYLVEGLVGTPVPVTPGGPPVIVGGGGRRVLQIGGRHADIVAFNPSLAAGVIDTNAGPTATAEATDRKMGWVRDAAGGRFDDIELQIRLELAVVTDDPEPTAEVLAEYFGMSVPEGYQTPHALIGTVGEMIENLQMRRERWGFSYIGIPADAVADMAPVVTALAGT